ncbi:hypothetical protein [Streptomyces triticisoli]|uniref:hypothetical protein n=1 Tax=Streptomyces triticisoli TaxID=2182797 RepID=UPI0018E571A7|nr:hypothetical protein [Streptomyces triticisoli]
MEHQPPAGGGGVEPLVRRGEADLAPAQFADDGDIDARRGAVDGGDLVAYLDIRIGAPLAATLPI